MTNSTDSKNITVEIETLYGREVIRPICDAAKTFAKMAGTKTLTRQQIELVKELGYKVLINQKAVAL